MVDRYYVVESDLARIRNRWCRFRYFLPLLSRTVLPLGEYDRYMLLVRKVYVKIERDLKLPSRD